MKPTAGGFISLTTVYWSDLYHNSYFTNIVKVITGGHMELSNDLDTFLELR